jgi:hypothetical protein
MPASSRGRPHSPSEGGGECCTGSAPAVPCHSASPAQSISWTRNQGVRRPTSPGAFQTQLSTRSSGVPQNTALALPQRIRPPHTVGSAGPTSGHSPDASVALLSPKAPQTAQVPSLEGHPASGPHQKRRPRALGDPPDQGRHGEQPLLPRSPPGRPDQAPPDRPQDRQDHCQDGLRRHQPDRRAGHPSPAGPARQ